VSTSLSKRFIESIFERERPVESDLWIAPGERRDFFGERNEDKLLSPLEIRIDEPVQVTAGKHRRLTLLCSIFTKIHCLAKILLRGTVSEIH
jgi:hypothetical protein